MFLLGHTQQSNIIFWMCPKFDLSDQINGVLLRMQTTGNEISISHEFGVVNT